MTTPNPDPESAALAALMRDARDAPSLPPRFQEGVWRRVERADLRTAPERGFWRNSGLLRFLHPRTAIAALAILILAGAALGTRNGTHAGRETAQARYLTTVAPDLLR